MTDIDLLIVALVFAIVVLGVAGWIVAQMPEDR